MDMGKERVASMVGIAVGVALAAGLLLFAYFKAQTVILDHAGYSDNVRLATRICHALSPEPRPTRKACRRQAREAYDPLRSLIPRSPFRPQGSDG